MSDEKFYTIKEAADLLELNENTIRRKARSGEIEAEKESNTTGYRISRSALIKYAQNNGKSHLVNNMTEKTIAGGIAGGLIGGALRMTPLIGISSSILGSVLAGATIGKTIGALGQDKSDAEKVNFPMSKEQIIHKLEIQKALIERANLQLQLAELDKDDSIESQKNILNIKIDIKDLEAVEATLKAELDYLKEQEKAKTSSEPTNE